MAHDRRNALKIIVGTFGAGAAGAVGIPVLRAAVSPVTQQTVSGGDDFVAIARVDALQDGGAPTRVPVVVSDGRDSWTKLPPTEVGAVWLQNEKGQITAHSTVCPHLGCGIDFDKKKDCFICPCHTSRFDREGAVSAGPSPRAMDVLESRVRDGLVEIQYRRFKAGISTMEIV